MAINQNHPFEELDGRRCAVVERNVSPERVEFLKYILEGNGYTVMVVPSPPPKAAPAPKPAEGEEAPVEPPRDLQFHQCDLRKTAQKSGRPGGDDGFLAAERGGIE
jgi:hypothetical protein